MKTLFLIAFIGVQTSSLIANKYVNPFTQEEQNRLENIKFNDLPTNIQIKLLKTKKSDGDDSHFCCATDTSLPIGVKIVSKTATKTVIVGTQVSHGTHACGFIHWGHCDNSKTLAYRQKMVTYVEHVAQPDFEQCHEGHVVCCKHYIMISHQCFELEKVSQNVDFFKAVANGTFGNGIFG